MASPVEASIDLAQPERIVPGGGPRGYDQRSDEPSLGEAQSILERMASAADSSTILTSLGGILRGRGSREPSSSDQTVGDRRHSQIWAAELRYRALVEKIPAVTFMAALDENVHELYVSPQIQTLLGFSQEEWLEDPFLWYNQLHPDDRDRWHNEFARTCATGVHFKAQYRFFARDGHIVWVQGEAQIVHDENGRPFFLQGIAFDITEIKRAEEAQQRSQEQLESMVRQRTSELASANQSLLAEIAERRRLEHELQSRNRQLAQESERKDHFLAVLAHELRNPLAPITMALELIRGGAAPKDDLEWAYGMMDRQVRHMSRLIDDLLDISRINRGKVELRIDLVDLCAIVRRAIETVRPRIYERKLELIERLPEHSVWVDGDGVRLEQVVVNLLTNAAKFTDAGGRVEIGMQPEGDCAVLRVSDTGVGIPPHMLDRIFDLFAQVDRSTSRSNQWGLGIGLALVRGLVQLHGGTVIASSDGPDRGSTFVVRLPLTTTDRSANRREDAVLAGPGVLPKLPARRILVVDDHEEFARSVAILLRSWGQSVSVANAGEQALRLAGAAQYDVVILDIGMPGMDGFQVARELRKSELTPPTIIALTGYGRPEDRARAAEAGFHTHLTKPVAPAALHALLMRLHSSPVQGLLP